MDGEFSEKEYEHYISYTNNFCESFNTYIIATNQKINAKLFIEVIKNLFMRNSNKRFKNEGSRNKKTIKYKYI